MSLEIVSFILGPLENNTYLAADTDTGQAVVIDPTFEIETVLEETVRRGWTLEAIWLTHAHFDHIAGVKTAAESVQPALPAAMHSADFPLWQAGGGAFLFGFDLEAGPPPSIGLEHGQILKLGKVQFEVRHTPGHTPGHVVFYAPEGGVVLCGDLIFYHGIGRTDLPGGDFDTLIASIREQILTLPPHTRLLSGHGPETTVEEEAPAF